MRAVTDLDTAMSWLLILPNRTLASELHRSLADTDALIAVMDSHDSGMALRYESPPPLGDIEIGLDQNDR